MTIIYNFAKSFLNMGIGIIPLYHRSKEPMIPAWGPYQSILSTNLELSQWFPTDWNNYGVVAGWCNLVVLDFDNIEWFNLWQLWHEMQGTQYVVSGFRVRTRKGMHVYVTTETPAANDKRISKSGGIDVQAQGKYVVGPGCVHPSGHVYEPIGEMFFPMVRDIESILPLDLFPRVTGAPVEFKGVPVEFHTHHTEYLSDPFAAASMDTRDLISKVKASVRIETLFSGVERSSTDGRWLKALCPFHPDKHQSAWIDTARQLCGCQVCGMRPMDAINLYARMHNVSERDAVKTLAEEVGIWR